MQVFNNLFQSWEDIKREFNTDAKEPDKILYANYTYESYSGDALVVFKQGDEYGWVEGGHCSCYGLEDQWRPEMYSAELFLSVLERKLEDSYRMDTDVLKFLKESLACQHT
jgi:hypothetical protein